MKKRLYYITRSFSPYQKGGGALMRRNAVLHLRKLGWNVIVVLPNYETNEVIDEGDLIRIPFKFTRNIRILSLLTRLGLLEDYLDYWVENCIDFLKTQVTEKDIVFSTTGGELGTLKLGAELKKLSGCSFVANYRDPIDYTIVNGRKKDKKFHVSREILERNILFESDLIVTSSFGNMENITNRFPEFSNKITNNYFGFMKELESNGESLFNSRNSELRVVYSGSMLTRVQKPELILPVAEFLEKGIVFEFVGEYNKNKVLRKTDLKNVKLTGFMDHEKYCSYMQQNADVGYLSLFDEYYGVCVPSKLYEYINLGLPIIGILPDGDAKDIINNMGYGLAVNPGNEQELINFLTEMKDSDFYSKFKSRVVHDREKWAMKIKVKELHDVLKSHFC